MKELARFLRGMFEILAWGRCAACGSEDRLLTLHCPTCCGGKTCGRLGLLRGWHFVAWRLRSYRSSR